jgi:hypothetical protein
LEDSLNELEAILIQVLEPRLNRRGPNWIEAEEFLQYIPSPEDDDDEVELEAWREQATGRFQTFALLPTVVIRFDRAGSPVEG